MTLDLKELRRKAEAATPGLWRENIFTGPLDCGDGSKAVIFGHAPIHPFKNGTDKALADAEFISAANPAVILSLLDRVEAFSSALDMTVACGLPRNCHIPNCKYNDGGQEVCTWHSHFENAREVLKRFEGAENE